MKEIWKDVIYQGEDFGWRFECSNLGKIRNALTKKIYTPHKGGIGYYQICTTVNGERKNIKIHKAVAETFLSNNTNKKCINHIDGNKENNNVDNLEWCTHKENTLHAIEIGLMKNNYNFNNYINIRDKTFRGEDNGFSKLTEENVKYIREHYVKKQKGKKCNRDELANLFNVSPQLIFKVFKREICKHVL